jgi:hypothetical protein
MKTIVGPILVLVAIAAFPQSEPSLIQGKFPRPVTFTADQDRQNMKDQLGVKTLRPGPSGNESAPNHANYDESTANPYPVLPDPLVLKNGKKVTTPEMWWKQRRPEIVEDLEREVYGRLPKNIPKVTWRVIISEREFVGFTPVIARQLVGHVDNSEYPLIDVNIAMTVVTPADAKGKVPLLMMFGPSVLPSPVQPNRDDFEKLNARMKDILAADTTIKKILDKYPAYNPLVRPAGVGPSGFPTPGANQTGDVPPSYQQLIAAGWGYAYIDPASIQADNGAGLTRGIIGLVNIVLNSLV